MTTPDGRFSSAAFSALWGGVRQDIQNNVVDADTAALTAAQGQAETQENRRRGLASMRPGLGSLLPLPAPPSGPAVGKYDAVPGPAGEGYGAGVVPQPYQVVSDHGPLVYGQTPDYADDLVGGVGFQAGRQEAPIRVFMGQRSQPGDSVVFATVGAAPRRSLLDRLLRRR